MSAVLRSNAGALAAKNKQRVRLLKTEIPAASRSTASEALMSARYYSSGTVTTKEQAALAHPYRIGGGPVPYGDAGMINNQTDRFANAWKANTMNNRDGSIVVLSNDSPEAKFMSGTRVMIARPILDRIREKTHPKFFARLRFAIQRVIRL